MAKTLLTSGSARTADRSAAQRGWLRSFVVRIVVRRIPSLSALCLSLSLGRCGAERTKRTRRSNKARTHRHKHTHTQLSLMRNVVYVSELTMLLLVLCVAAADFVYIMRTNTVQSRRALALLSVRSAPRRSRSSGLAQRVAVSLGGRNVTHKASSQIPRVSTNARTHAHTTLGCSHQSSDETVKIHNRRNRTISVIARRNGHEHQTVQV